MASTSLRAVAHTRDTPLCSLATTGRCTLGAAACPNVHGDTCPFCKKACLHPLRPEVSPTGECEASPFSTQAESGVVVDVLLACTPCSCWGVPLPWPSKHLW